MEKTIFDIQSVFDDLFYTEATVRCKGLLQLLDPRVKLLTILSLLIGVNLVRTIPEIAVIIGYLLLLAVGSRLPMARFLWRIAVFTIIFTGIVVLPSLFNFVNPGETLWRVSKHISITKPGAYGAGLLMLRSLGSISLIYLLTSTTKWVDILRSLRIMKVPALFIATLEMTEHYIFLGLELAANLFTARKSRTFGKSTGKEGRRFVSYTIGNILIRTTVMGDGVYQAMISRGYTGEIKTISNFRVGWVDYLWLTVNFVLLFIFIAVCRFF